jgi:putative transcriptional regulator
MKKEHFDALVESVREGGRILRGEQKPSRVFDYGDHLKKLRKRLGKSQSEFASMIRVPVSTLQNWEQGRRMPQGPALALLKLVESLPEKSLKVLQQ